jgi:hypothetical protein
MSEYVNATPFPSVTQVLRPWVDTQWFTPESRDRGSAVHGALAQYLGGKPAFLANLPPEWRGYFDSGRRWIDANVAEVLLSEARLSDPQWRFCGQPDLIALLNDGSATLLDWKTGAAARWHRLQIAGYRHLARPVWPTDRGLTIRLHPDGSMPSVDEHPANIEQDLNRLLSAVNLWWFFHPEGKD